MKKKLLKIMLIFVIINSCFANIYSQNNIVFATSQENKKNIVKQTKVDPQKYGEEGHVTITNVNGNFYKDYKQGNYPSMGVTSKYSQMILPNCKSAFGYTACGPTAAAVVLSGYGVLGTIGKYSLPYVCGELIGTHEGGTNSGADIKKAFDKYGIPSTVYYTGKENTEETISQALKEGRPVVANVNGGYYSPAGHWIAVLGYDEKENLVISNPCGEGIYGGNYNSEVKSGIKLDYFVDNVLGGGSGTFLIPDQAPNTELKKKNYKKQEYKFTEEEIILLAGLIEGETPPKVLHDTIASDWDMETCMNIGKVTGYACINYALDNNITIKEEIYGSDMWFRYGGGMSVQPKSKISEESMECARWCATYDCTSVTNPDGVPMSRAVQGESGWDNCIGSNNYGKPKQLEDLTCFWVLDWPGRGTPGVIQDYDDLNGNAQEDGFFCYSYLEIEDEVDPYETKEWNGNKNVQPTLAGMKISSKDTAGIILAQFAMNFYKDYADETSYGIEGREKTYTGEKVDGKYVFDCVGWISFAVHQSLKLGSESYTEFAVPPGAGNIPYYTNGFECIKGDVNNANNLLSKEEVENTVMPGDILFCGPGGANAVLYVGDNKIIHISDKLKLENLYDNSMKFTGYCAIGRISENAAKTIKLSDITTVFKPVSNSKNLLTNTSDEEKKKDTGTTDIDNAKKEETNKRETNTSETNKASDNTKKSEETKQDLKEDKTIASGKVLPQTGVKTIVVPIVIVLVIITILYVKKSKYREIK